MKTYVQAAPDGRIEVIRQVRKRLGPEWTEVEYKANLHEYRLVDGQLVYDPLPIPPEPEKTVDQLRREAYPAVGEQLDAIIKILKTLDGQRGHVDIGEEGRQLIATVSKVKTRFPRNSG